MIKKKLIFVYNADGGLVSSALDAIHKVVSPSTYDCNLCKITYGALTEKKDWRRFRKNLGMETEFLHRNQFEKRYELKGKKFPAVFLVFGKKVKEIIPAKKINDCEDINDLKKLVEKKIRNLV